MADPKETLAAGRYLAKKAAPYLSARLLSYAVREAPGLGTIGITKNGIVLVDLDWIAGKDGSAPKTPEQCGGLWVHESFHDLMRHGDRCGARDPRLFNIAGDLAINPSVIDMGLQLPAGGCFPEQMGFQRGLSADEYYTLLYKQQQQAQQPQQGQKGKGKGQKGGKGDGEQGEEDGSGDGSGGGKDADHDHPGGGKPGDKPHTSGGWCGSCAGREMPDEPAEDDPDGRGEAEQERIRRETAAAIRNEGQQRNRGKLPAELARWAEEMLKPPRVPWQQRLARACRRAVAWRAGGVSHRFDAPGKRQAGLGYGVGVPVLPRLRQPIPRVAIVVDTSGSMSPKDLQQALEESKGVLAAVGAEVEFLSCDARVHGVGPIRRIEDALKLLRGGGGTDFRPAFTELERRKPRPEVVVFCTDGCGPAPEVPPTGMHVIWLLIGDYQHTPVTWGEVISLDDKA